MSVRSRKSYQFGSYLLIPDEKQLMLDGKSVPLTPKAFDLLLVLVENAGHLMEKKVLMDLVWADSFVEEANLPVKISELRRALSEGADGEPMIETVPRRGYRFLAPVLTSDPSDEPVLELAADDETEVPRVVSPQTAEHRTGPVWPLVLVGVILAAAGLLFGLNAGGMRDRLFSSQEARQIRALAVLPLENLSGDDSQEYFADGMTEALITDLAKLRDLRVISRASVQKYKEVRMPLREIARELNVDALLTGSVVRSGDRVRISVLLVDAPAEQNLWAESYERDLRDVIALQQAVTRDVVARIRSKLGPQDLALDAAPTVDPKAYDHYLRGKFHLHRQIKSDNEIAIAALEEAVAADPNFAAAHAELAHAYVWKLFLFDPGNERQWAEKAFLASEKAIAIDPNLAVAYLARGRALWTPANRFPHDRAIQEYRKALAADPNLDEARNQLALVYNHIGAFDEALHELEAAVQTNPGNTLARFRIGQTLGFQGKYEESLKSLRELPAGTSPTLAGHQVVWALFNLGRKEEAAATMDQFAGDYPDENRALLESIKAVMAASDGRVADAERHIESAITLGRDYGHFHHTTYYVAIAYAIMERPDDAIKWLETTAETGFPCYPLFERDPNLDKLRGNPRFANFLARMKERWESYGAVISA